MAALENLNLFVLSQDNGILFPGPPGWTVAHASDSVTRNTFEVGDQLRFVDSDGRQYGGTYTGRDEKGFVVRQTSGPDLYFSDQSIELNTTITVQADPYPVCFLRGTRLETRRGAIAVEDLIIGDHIRGSTGWQTVKWIGWRKYDAQALSAWADKSHVAPVRIKANALGDNAPSNDLSVSPWHHLLVDGHLVRAKDLVNDVTVVQDTDLQAFDYFHVELESFDLVMAHGIYSESWADGGNRSFFQNADVAALRPEDLHRRRASRPGFDHLVLRKGKKLETIQKRVVERAQVLAVQATAMTKAA